MVRLIQAYVKNNRGQAVVEFALVFPLFVWLMLGMIDFGRIFHELIVVSHAAREGARVAAVGKDNNAIEAAVQAAAVSINTDGPGNPVQVTINPQSNRTAGQPVTVTVTHGVTILTPFMSSIVTPNPFPVTGTAVMRN